MNIVLLTNIYPTLDPNYPGTKICHFFTREWQAMGHQVRVVHYESCFPRFYYKIGGIFREQIMARTGCLVDMTIPDKPATYEIEGVKVLRNPLKKYIPHGSVPKKQVKNAFRATLDYLEEDKFIPDVITSHFAFPQLEFLNLLKNHYPMARTCLVMHSGGEYLPSNYKNYKELMPAVDVWGFRSLAFKNQFDNLYGKKKSEFLCYSGIPEEYIQPRERDFSKGINSFAFLGSLYKLKNVDITIQALAKTFQSEPYTFDVIGDGAEMSNLVLLVKNLHQEDKVRFRGRQTRDMAQSLMSGADCFVMVSTREAFGLVYLEAMAKGMIPIATRGQGIDGIIIDGENGFLCEPENVEALASIIQNIRKMPAAKLSEISHKAIETAKGLTNKKAAETYINSVMK